MADRRDFWFLQAVTEGDLDDAFDGLERADRALSSDLGLTGITFGLDVEEHSPTPDLTVDVAPGAAYDADGQRCRVSSTQRLDLSVDYNGSPTTVTGGGNSKIVSIFLFFERELDDPQIDGNSVQVYFVRNESFDWKIVQGSEAVSPTAPGLESDKILLADVTLTFGQTQILNASIDMSRAQDAFKISAGALEVAVGTPEESDQAILTLLEGHISGTSNKHPATAIDYAGGAAWADGTTNPAATVEAQLDKVLTDLGAGSGTAKIASPGNNFPAWGITIPAGTLATHLTYLAAAAYHGYDGGANWADGSANGNGSVEATLDNIFSSLAGATGNDGAGKIGAKAIAGSPDSFSAGSVRSQLDALLTAVNARGRIASAETITGAWVHNGVAGDTNAALQTTAVPTSRKLLWAFNLGATVKGRMYARAVSASYPYGFELTVNAAWNGTNWQADDTGAAAKLFSWEGTLLTVFTGDDTKIVQRRKNSTGSAWSETSWDTADFAIGLGNPAATAATFAKNLLVPKLSPKAWGIVSTDGGGGVSIVEGVGLASVSIVSGDIRVTLRNAFKSANWHSEVNSRKATQPWANGHSHTTTTFDIRTSDNTPVQVSASSNALEIGFACFGEQ